jgi:DNA topoisomerase IA
VKITADCPEAYIFTDTGVKVIDKGWTKVYPTEIEEKTVPNSPVSKNRKNHHS